jgi:hypothetical protein
MKPSDIITESIEHRELEEAPMGFWKNLGYKVAGSVLNPFDSRSLYQGKQEIGKRADALAREFRKYLATIPGNQATVTNLLKWLKFKKLETAGVEKLISDPAPMEEPRTSNVASNKSSGVRQRVEPRLSEDTMTFNTVLSPKQIDSFILRAIQDTANKEYFEPSAQIDDQGTRSASSEPKPQPSPATSAQQPASSEPTPQQPASSEPTPQPSLATSAQPKDELNDIRRLSGIVQDHEDRIKKLEVGKTDNRVKFTGKKTGT